MNDAEIILDDEEEEALELQDEDFSDYYEHIYDEKEKDNQILKGE